MPLLISLADIRDVFLIIYAILGIVLLVVLIVVSLALLFAVKGLIRKVNGLLDDSVRPAVGSIRDTAETVRGTTDFMGRRAASPIIRTYGAVAGVRKGLGVLAGLRRTRQ